MIVFFCGFSRKEVAVRQSRLDCLYFIVVNNFIKVAYWTNIIVDVLWAPQTDDTHDGILKDMFLPREAKTTLDITTHDPMIYFMLNETDYLDSATIELTSEEGKLVFQSDEQWDVKFSEKNEVLYMTITDSNGKTVYYQQK